jgi:hypothetical protein
MRGGKYFILREEIHVLNKHKNSVILVKEEKTVSEIVGFLFRSYAT